MKGFILLAFLVGIAVSDPVGECPEHDPSMPVYLPDSQKCGLYYECSNGIPVVNNCGPNLEFSPTLHVCVEPIDSGCEAPDHQATNAPPTTTVAVDFDEVDFYDAVGNCPPHDTNDTIYLPDNRNCSVYYVCSNGRPIGLVCPPTMEFSPSQHVCVLDIDSDCEAQEGNDSMEVGHQGPSPRKPVGECPEKDPANPVFLPDDANCQLYYECSNGVPVQNHCADDLNWNPTVNTCEPPSLYACDKGSSSASPPETTAGSRF